MTELSQTQNILRMDILREAAFRYEELAAKHDPNSVEHRFYQLMMHEAQDMHREVLDGIRPRRESEHG